MGKQLPTPDPDDPLDPDFSAVEVTDKGNEHEDQNVDLSPKDN